MDDIFGKEMALRDAVRLIEKSEQSTALYEKGGEVLQHDGLIRLNGWGLEARDYGVTLQSGSMYKKAGDADNAATKTSNVTAVMISGKCVYVSKQWEAPALKDYLHEKHGKYVKDEDIMETKCIPVKIEAEQPAPPLEITKMLTVSTAHISEKTASMLDDEADENNMCLAVYEKSAKGGDPYGWFIYMPDYVDTERVPDDLLALLALTTAHGCGVLCLDNDGPEIQGLKTYDW